MAQVYDFQAENEKPTSVCCHPCKAEFACGFKNGSIRLFSLSTTSLMFELKEHCEEVHSILFNKSGELLYSASRDGTLIMYRTLNFNNDYEVLRYLPNSIARQATISSNAMTLDESGQKLAVIGPSEFVVTVFAARTLDQVKLRCVMILYLPYWPKLCFANFLALIFVIRKIWALGLINNCAIFKF